MKLGIVRTFTGILIDVRNPQPSDVNRRDLAHQLSLEQRWGGATLRPYSVAEHSLLVARFCRHLAPEDRREEAALHGLLHDGHEAYIKDIQTPIKRLLGPQYEEWARRLDVAIYASLGVTMPDEQMRNAIHVADGWAAWCEEEWLVAKIEGHRSVRDRPTEAALAASGIVGEIQAARDPKRMEAGWLSYLEFLLRHIASTKVR